MPEKISILLPTLKRVQKVKDLLQNIEQTVQHRSSVEICFFVNSDDLDTMQFVAELEAAQTAETLQIKHTHGMGVIFSDMWNKAFEVATGDICMLCGDDVVFRTQGWDDIIRNRFENIPDKIAYVYVDDGAFHGAAGIHGFLHRNWIEVLGYVTTSIFIYNWADIWIDEIAKILNRHVYVPEVVIEHMHWVHRKGSIDEVYHKNQSTYDAQKPAIEKLFADTRPLREEAAKKLQNFIEEYTNGKTESVQEVHSDNNDKSPDSSLQ